MRKRFGRYHAFVSYAHEDRKTVEWVCKLLSVFWVPWKWRRRIFWDRDSLRAGGGLSATLQDALKESRFLIVCCSKDSADSQWVNREVTEFLANHPADNVLACLVGPKTPGPFPVPRAVQDVEGALGDELFKPDLRGNPEALRGRERKAATREALALLAPLVGLPGKDELLDQRKKNVIVGTLLLCVVVFGAPGWKAWDNRPESQIKKILFRSPELVKGISTDLTASRAAPPLADAIAGDPQAPRQSAIDEWLRTLVLTGHPNDALEAARKIERADARLHAMVEVAEQLLNGAAIRHYVDPWGRQAWEVVSDRRDETTASGTSNPAKEAAVAEVVQAANHVVGAARRIETAATRFKVTIRVADALCKVGKNAEARLVALDALEAARRIEDAGSRTAALIAVSQTLARAGHTDEATPIAAEAFKVARDIPDKESRSAALGAVAEAAAEAGQRAAAQEIAQGIQDASSRSLVMVGIVDALVKAGRYADALAAARQITSVDDRAKALVRIGRALARAGKRDEARQVANEALATASPLDVDMPGRYTPSASVMEILAELGRTEEALEMAGHARSPGDRSRRVVWVVGALIKSGRHAEASRVADEAIAAARQIEKPEERTAVLIDLGEALANSDRSAEVGRIAQEALGALPGRGSYWQLDEIVRLLLKAGKNEEAKQVAERELSAIQELPPGRPRTTALASRVILTAVARSGTSAETRQVAQLVLEAAQQRKFEHEANRARFLVKIVGALAQAGKVDEAVEAAEKIVNSEIRLQALVRVAEELAKTGEVVKARSVINEAQQLAQQFTIVSDKSFALSEVSKGLARLRYFRLARETVEAQSSPSGKLAAYIVIVREHAVERRHALAKFFEEEKAD